MRRKLLLPFSSLARSSRVVSTSYFYRYRQIRAYSPSLFLCQATPRKNRPTATPETTTNSNSSPNPQSNLDPPSQPRKSRRITDFKVDRSGLLQPDDILFPEEPVEPVNRPDKEPLTPLAIDLYALINSKGPITVHEYMSHALNNSVHGYYQALDTEKIGIAGDFITSPEISQLFGEMIGLWIYSTWEAMGSPSSFHLVELGPGKGTLMVGILKVLKRFPRCLAAVEVHFVELSLRFRQVQYDNLHKEFSSSKVGGEDKTPLPTSEVIKDEQRYEVSIAAGKEGEEKREVPVYWNSFFNQVPTKYPCIVIGQEFLDAFPVHQFVYTNKGWREKLIDIDRAIYAADDEDDLPPPTNDPTTSSNEATPKPSYPYHFRMIVAPRTTPAVTSLIASENEKVKQFRESLQSTSASPLNFPEESQVKEGDGLEIAPLALAQCEDVASRIMKVGGAALFIDYGEDYAQEDTIRGFKRHKQVPHLSEPGTVDITADVNFAACRKVAAKKGVHVLPLLLQGQFLMNMGIAQRVQRLIEQPTTTDEDAEMLVESMKKLVLPEEMGKRFKVLGMIHPSLKEKVYGF